MGRAVKFGMPVLAVLLMAGTAYSAVQSWRPVMPEFVIDVRTADSGDKAPELLLIYGEEGSDPFLEGPLGTGRRISGCQTMGSLCISKAARNEFGTVQDRRQSLQVRRLTGKGANPIVGGVSWTGAPHPRQVRVTCDLRILDARRSCAISDVII